MPSNQFDPLIHQAALRDFRDARLRAALRDVLAHVTGQPADLLSYEEATRLLKASGSTHRGLHEIPLDAIVGSVGRYGDFTREFLPRRQADEARWTSVKLKTIYQGGLPPIEVFKIGEAYFVLDGNHRVSVARQLGATTIQAYVTEVHTRAPLGPDARPDDLIIAARYADFLEHTELDRTRPGADLRVTAPGSYRLLLAEIEARQEQETGFSLAEAAARWYDETYLPVCQVIRERGLLRDFPDRTETDLYAWVAQHREAIEDEVGWEVDPALVVEDLSAGGRPNRLVQRAGDWLRHRFSPPGLRKGPSAGQWRRERSESRDPAEISRHSRLFVDILTPVSADELDWNALDQALLVAGREGAAVRGLLTLPETSLESDSVVVDFLAEFERRCRQAGIAYSLRTEIGLPAETIIQQARWADLAVISLGGPLDLTPAGRLNSDLRLVLQRCSRPVLVLAGQATAMRRALLAYDGSPKANEALFVAAYLAGRWAMPLIVVSVEEGERVTSQTLAKARHYLASRGVQPIEVVESGEVGAALLRTARSQDCDVIIMGGYGYGPMLELFLGSTVDHVLAGGSFPVLICR